MKNKQVVVIMTDAQRWDMVNAYRNTGLKTPNIDSLAQEGIRFERGYTTQPVCQPARAGIFTGQYPHSVGSWTNSYGVSDTARTIGQRLTQDGIHTAYIGKWHLDGGDYFGLGKAPDGWDPEYWYDMRCYLDELTPEERVLSRTDRSNHSPGVSREFTFGHRCSNRAIDFLENHGAEDFLLVLSYDEPHDPYLCPTPYVDMYKDYTFPKSENVYDTLEDKPQHQQVWAGDSRTQDKDALEISSPDYFGCNSFIDDEIGRVLKAIDTHAEDAVIIYTSDHGGMLHSHCLHGKGPATYDEITRIPYIIKGKDIPQGVTSPHPVSHINITPTILELMGSNIPPVIEGESLVPQLKDPSHRVNDYIFIEFGRYEVDHDGFGGFQPLRCVFDGRYKLTINLLTSDELYDLENDPGEMVNLIESQEHTAVRDHLHDVILEEMNRTRDPFRGYYWELRPWRKNPPHGASWSYTGMTRQREEDTVFEPRQLDYATGLPMEEAVRGK